MSTTQCAEEKVNCRSDSEQLFVHDVELWFVGGSRSQTGPKREADGQRIFGRPLPDRRREGHAMTRRKGERTDNRIDYEYPHQVEIAIPSGGLGTRQNDMHAFCREHGLQFATRGIGKSSGDPEADAVRYCFRHAGDAEAFHMAFGGGRVALPIKKRPRPSFGGHGLWSKRRT